MALVVVVVLGLVVVVDRALVVVVLGTVVVLVSVLLVSVGGTVVVVVLGSCTTFTVKVSTLSSGVAVAGRE